MCFPLAVEGLAMRGTPTHSMLRQTLLPWTLLVLTSWVAMQAAHCKTVVIISTPFTSHTRYHTRVARALSALGHDVWLTMPTYLLEKGYVNTSAFRVIPYQTLPLVEERTASLFIEPYFEGKPRNIFEYMRVIGEIFDDLLGNENLLQNIKDKDADLIVIDNITPFYRTAIIPHRLGKRFAFVGSTYDPIHTRIPFSTAETPHFFLPYSNKMTFSQRLETFLYFVAFTVFNPLYPSDIVSVYAPEMPYVPMDVLVGRAEVWLVETDHILDYARPTLPNVKLIGGTASGPAGPLFTHFRSFMEDAREGAVVVSFGSYVLGVPRRISDKLFQVFQRLPMKVIFRSNLTSPDPAKILTSPWLPQNDLLGHPNTKVFVSHCGKNGQYEALYHAVPVVAMPLFGDQPYNAERVRRKGFAEVLDLNTCTADQLTQAILTVAREPRYKQAATKYSRLFRKLYGVPMETAAFWLDHVMEHGGDYMRSAGQEMPLYQFLMLDVVLLLVSVMAAVVTLVSVCVCAVCRCFCKTKMKSD